MKIGLENRTYLHRSSSTSSGAKEHEGGILKNASTACNNKENSNYKINTTASKNTRGRMSFKGGAATVNKEAKVASARIVKWAQRLEDSEKAQKFFEFVGQNNILTEAIFAVFITCGLRPAAIVATPGKGENKEKNLVAAAHSIASGIIGLGMTVLISQPIKKAIDYIKKDLIKTHKEDIRKIVKNPPEKLKNLTTKELIKQAREIVFNNNKALLERGHNPIFLPIRAMVTIAIIPSILVALGIKKSDKHKEDKSETQTQYTQTPMFKNTKRVFQSFAGVNQHESK